MADLVSPCAFFQQPATLPAFRRHRQPAASEPAPCASANWRAMPRPAGPCARLRSFSVDLPCRSSSIPDRRSAGRYSAWLAFSCTHVMKAGRQVVSRCGSEENAAPNRVMAPKNQMRRFEFFLALRLPVRYGRSAAIAGCGSSVVEHSLGKGEVESSILSRSTSLSRWILTIAAACGPAALEKASFIPVSKHGYHRSPRAMDNRWSGHA